MFLGEWPHPRDGDPVHWPAAGLSDCESGSPEPQGQGAPAVRQEIREDRGPSQGKHGHAMDPIHRGPDTWLGAVGGLELG